MDGGVGKEKVAIDDESYGPIGDTKNSMRHMVARALSLTDAWVSVVNGKTYTIYLREE